MGLHVRSADIVADTNNNPQMPGGVTGVVSKTVFGPNVSMAISTRPAGYHSVPHTHGPEIHGYVLSGEMWIFVNGKGYLLKPGDFIRVPQNAVHWAWNRGSEPFTWVQVLIPLMQNSGRRPDLAVPLFEEGEPMVNLPAPSHAWFDESTYDVAEIETRALREAGEGK